MNTNLGAGLSAKCILSPSLKCGDKKSSTDYISKIVEVNNKQLKHILKNEIDISKIIIKASNSKQFLHDNYALIETICPQPKFSKKTIKKCNLSKNNKSVVLNMRNVGCNSQFKGSKNRTTKRLAKLLKSKHKSVNNNENKYCGDLSSIKVLENLKLLGEKYIIGMTIKILNAVKYLHSLKISHCDIKPGNIVMDSNNETRIIDFGSSIYTPSVKNDKILKEKLGMFTQYFIPPEIAIVIFKLNGYHIDKIMKQIFGMCGLKKTPKNIRLVNRLYKNRTKLQKSLLTKIIYKYDVYSIGKLLEIIYMIIRTPISKKMNEIIKIMTEPDYSKRATINKVINTIGSYTV